MGFFDAAPVEEMPTHAPVMIGNISETDTDLQCPEIKVKLDDGAFLPERAHGHDAGADLRCREDVDVPPHGSVAIDTGAHIQIPPHTCGLLVSKSGLNVVFEMTSTGLIDEGFTGSIGVRVYNHGDKPYHFKKGDKVSQIVMIPVLYPSYVEADEIDGFSRGSAGYGSTGRQ